MVRRAYGHAQHQFSRTSPNKACSMNVILPDREDDEEPFPGAHVWLTGTSTSRTRSRSTENLCRSEIEGLHSEDLFAIILAHVR